MNLKPKARPTRVRFRVLFLLCLLAMITYLDRAMYGSDRTVTELSALLRDTWFLVY